MLPSQLPVDRAILLLAGACAVGFAEELIGREYLIPRLEALIGSTWKSILLSALIFGLLHSQKSFTGMVVSCLSGIVWGVGFCATRRVWPVAISHAMWDFVVDSHFSTFLSG